MKPPEDFFPDFFVVGAPRCGTTALSKYLKGNRQVCFSMPKEPHFFTRMLAERPDADIRLEYVERFFSHWKPKKHRVAGEGSTSYLFAPDAIKQIHQLNPRARFIAMVRNPLEMVPSLHQLMLYQLEEDVESFETAWGLQEARFAGRRIPRYCTDARQLQYRHAGRLGSWVEQLILTAGESNALVITYDDFKADTLSTYKRVLDFVGVDYDGRVDFPRFLGTRHYRLGFVHRAINRAPKKLGGFQSFIELRTQEGRRRGKTLKRRLQRRVLGWNTTNRPPKPLSPRMRRELSECFSEDVARLGQLVGRDLGHWLS